MFSSWLKRRKQKDELTKTDETAYTGSGDEESGSTKPPSETGSFTVGELGGHGKETTSTGETKTRPSVGSKGGMKNTAYNDDDSESPGPTKPPGESGSFTVEELLGGRRKAS